VHVWKKIDDNGVNGVVALLRVEYIIYVLLFNGVFFWISRQLPVAI